MTSMRRVPGRGAVVGWGGLLVVALGAGRVGADQVRTESAPAATLTVTSPIGGETWAAGTTQTIRWSSTNATGNVQVDVYKGGQYIQSIGGAPMADGLFTWSICPAIGDGTDCTVRVSWQECGQWFVAMSGTFTVTGSSPQPTLTVTSPIGGETWPAGTTQTIRWSSTNATGDVWLYVYKGGQCVRNIGYVPVADGAFTWDICPTIGDGADYSINIESLDECGRWFGAVSGTFTIADSASPPSLTVTSPIGGDAWPAGTTQTITWTSTNPTGNVQVGLYRGDEHVQSIGYVPMADGILTWDICPTVGDGTDYAVRVTWSDCGPYVQATSSPLVITGSLPHATPTLTSPIVGDIWPAGTTQTITWSSTNATGDLQVELRKGDEHVLYIGYVPAADGVFTWDICSAIGDGTDYSIHLEGPGECGRWFEATSGRFTITGSAPRPTLTLTSPIGGETWPAGTTQTITWSSTNASGSINIFLGLEDGSLWWIGNAPMSAGALHWLISPYLGDANYLLHLEWWECGPGVWDSSQYFAIAGSHRLGDCDGDGDVDLTDYGILEGCLSGPLAAEFTGGEYPLPLGCEAADFDIDRDVDLADFMLFQGAVGGGAW